MNILLIALIAVLSLSTLLFGGVGNSVALGVGLCGVSVGIVAWLQNALFTRVQMRSVGYALGGAYAVLALMIFSLLPISVWVHPFYATLSDVGLTPLWPAASLTVGKTLNNMALMMGYMGFGVALAVLGAQEKAASTLRKAVALVVFAFAVYGLVVFALGNSYVLWEPKQFYIRDLSSTFINRNMAANMLGLGILAALGCALARVGEISSQLTFTQRLKAFHMLVLRPGRGWLLVALVCFVALMFTSSRAGFIAVVAGVMVFLGSLIVARPAVRVPLGGGLVFLVVLMGFVFAVGSAMTTRIERTGVGRVMELRPAMNDLSYTVLAQTPFVGQGSGAWQAAAAIARTDGIALDTGTLDYAHNTYLQWAIEMGWAGAALAAAMVAALITVFIIGVRTRRRQVAWPALGLAVMTQQLVHGWPDVSFLMPAVVLGCMTLLVPAFMQALPNPQNFQTESPRSTWPRVVEGVGCGVGSLGVLLAIALLWANIAALPAAATVAALQRGENVQPDVLAKAIPALKTCQMRNPVHPTCGADLTLAMMAQAANVGVRTQNGQILLSLALREGQTALAANPANSVLAYRLARIEGLRSGAQAAMPYVVQSILAGPAEPKLALARANLAVAGYDALRPEDKPIVQQNLVLLWQLAPVRLWKAVQGRAGAEAVLRDALANEASAPDFAQHWERVTARAW